MRGWGKLAVAVAAASLAAVSEAGAVPSVLRGAVLGLEQQLDRARMQLASLQDGLDAGAVSAGLPIAAVGAELAGGGPDTFAAALARTVRRLQARLALLREQDGGLTSPRGQALLRYMEDQLAELDAVLAAWPDADSEPQRRALVARAERALGQLDGALAALRTLR